MGEDNAPKQDDRDDRMFWSCADIMHHLGVSEPTAYKLMAKSGAEIRNVPRRRLVDVRKFLSYVGADPI